MLEILLHIHFSKCSRNTKYTIIKVSKYIFEILVVQIFPSTAIQWDTKAVKSGIGQSVYYYLHLF